MPTLVFFGGGSRVVLLWVRFPLGGLASMLLRVIFNQVSLYSIVKTSVWKVPGRPLASRATPR